MSPVYTSAEHAAAVDALHQATAIYTREPVAQQLLDRIAWPHAIETLADTSCGDGVFLVAAAGRMDLVGLRDDVDAVAARLRGYEIHPQAADRARQRLASLLRDNGWTLTASAEAARRIVTHGDFLTHDHAGERWSCIVGNPPYLRFVGCPRPLRELYERQLPRWACADLLHAFLARCAERLTADGQIILVTADRWLFAASASGLREALGTQLALTHVERLEAGSAFHRPKQRRSGTPARVHPVMIHLRAGTQGTRLTRAPLYPDAWDEAPHEGPTLGSEATIRLAPWLGPDGVFVLDSEQAADFPPECLVPTADTRDIKNGVLREPTRFAIRTSPEGPPPDSVQAHLEREAHRLPPRARRVPSWLPAESWHRLDLSREALLIPRIARSLRPVRLPPGVLPINHNLTIATAGRASLDDIERVLQSDEADRWIRARAAKLEDGFLSMTTSILRQLPWPAAA